MILVDRLQKRRLAPMHARARSFGSNKPSIMHNMYCTSSRHWHFMAQTSHKPLIAHMCLRRSPMPDFGGASKKTLLFSKETFHLGNPKPFKVHTTLLSLTLPVSRTFSDSIKKKSRSVF